jgi:branched-chain amino acid transport system permease protein
MDLAHRIKDAALAGGVAGLLALPLLGFETVDTGGPLGINYRLQWVGYAFVTVFLGRLLLMALRDWRRRGQMSESGAEARAHRNEVMAEIGKRADKWLMPALIALAVVLPFMPFTDRTVVDLATVVLIYVMLGWGLNIVVGLAGLLDLGYVAFYAVGAYTYALLSTQFGFTFWSALPLAGMLAGTMGILLGFPVLRLRGDYLAIVTLGFGEIIRIILLNWGVVTNGPKGISGIPRPSFFGLPFTADPPEGTTSFSDFFGLDYSSLHRIIFLYYLILILALITNAFTRSIRRLPVGRAWEALREDEIACKALGINPTSTKLTAFAIGAMFGGFAGSFFATRQGYISPDSFTFIESAVILAIVVLGGMGSQAGIVLAAALLVLLPELARQFALFRMLAFGAAMVLIMIWRPQGLLSYRVPTIKLPLKPGPSP